MRRIILLLSGIILLLSVPAAVFAADQDKAGNVVSLRGEAVVERADKELPAENKFTLLEMDSVATKEHSRVKMLFRDDSIFNLGAMSKLSVSKYLYNPVDKRAESVYDLLDGKLRAVVGNADLAIKTPTAFAAARGTIFIIWYNPAANTTGLAVLEGSVVIKNADGSVGGEQTLTAGQMTKVTGKNPPSLPEGFRIINQTGPAIGNDIGPIAYGVEIEGTPEIAFIDNWRGATGKRDFLDWDAGGPPEQLLTRDPNIPGSSWLYYGGQ